MGYFLLSFFAREHMLGSAFVKFILINGKRITKAFCSLDHCIADFRVKVRLGCCGHPFTQAERWQLVSIVNTNTSCTHIDKESRLPPQHEIITSPDWLPGVMKIYFSRVFLSLTPLSHSPIRSSIYHLAPLSVEIVYLSLVSQHLCGCVSYPSGTVPHNTWLRTLGTVKLQRLPLNLGKCRAQASSKLLNNQCVPMVTGACMVLAN